MPVTLHSRRLHPFGRPSIRVRAGNFTLPPLVDWTAWGLVPSTGYSVAVPDRFLEPGGERKIVLIKEQSAKSASRKNEL